MAQHRYRQHKVKREHTIIEGLLPLLECAAEIPGVKSVTPGRINKRSRTGQAGLYFQYKTETGLKLIGRSTTAVQEVFLVTDDPEQVIVALVAQGLVPPPKEGLPGRETGKERPRKETANAKQGGGAHSDAEGGRRRSSQGQGQRRDAKEGDARLARAPGDTSDVENSRQATRKRRRGPRRSGPSARRATGRGSAHDMRGVAPTRPPESARDGGLERNEKVEPKLWNELVRLHQELLDLERSLDAEASSASDARSP